MFKSRKKIENINDFLNYGKFLSKQKSPSGRTHTHTHTDSQSSLPCFYNIDKLWGGGIAIGSGIRIIKLVFSFIGRVSFIDDVLIIALIYGPATPIIIYPYPILTQHLVSPTPCGQRVKRRIYLFLSSPEM